jgi:predicted AlkP superfamily phosphohydrolase/phosphomutase
MKKILLFVFVLLLVGLGVYNYTIDTEKNNLKLYWFIPDGVRAEPELFNIYKWAKEGKLPNIKKLMDMGTYGYSKPTFPSHTPVNFATLLTGSYPETHGIDDGPMRAIGLPLDKVAAPGFRSTSRKVPAIWKTLEDEDMKVTILSVPGSTPPEIDKGVVLRGRWGGWGADFFALNFETKGNLAQRIKQGLAAKLFFFGAQLTNYVDPVESEGWVGAPKSYSTPLEVEMKGWGTPVYGYIYDSTDDKTKNYDRVAFSKDKNNIFADLKPGEWSEWEGITLKWKAIPTEEKTIDVVSDVKVALIKIDKDGFFRARLFYNNLNKQIAYPPEAADMVKSQAGPMVDFVDNFPFQLGYYPEDKKIFMDEANMSFEWHTKAVSTLVDQFNPNIVIHDIYTPNQMLTSPYLMPYFDPKSARYSEASNKQKDEAQKGMFDMYKRLDNIIGEILKEAGSKTYVVFSSDHGNIPLDRYVNLNNLFAKKGWLKFTIDPATGEPVIDWNSSTVIYLKMAHVYVNPNGLAGKYERASGEAYESLRDEVKTALLELEDGNGVKPVIDITPWEEAKDGLNMDPDRVGDLVIANSPGYGWSEDMDNDLTIFVPPQEGGYKQAVDPNVPGMWSPFMIAGPGIKKNNFIGDKPISHVDQYPTIMKALGVKSPNFVQGEVLKIFKGN